MFAEDLQAQADVIADPDLAAANGRFQTMLLRSPATRVEGGADEILRNIIAERVLACPPTSESTKTYPSTGFHQRTDERIGPPREGCAAWRFGGGGVRRHFPLGSAGAGVKELRHCLGQQPPWPAEGSRHA